jgi:hypothetical protein
MNVGRLWRVANLYLCLSGLLSGAMAFAPIAYASNFTAGIHASIYGAWVEIETSMGHGVSLSSKLGLLELPMHMPYAAMAGIGCLGCLVLVFINRNAERKQLWIGRAIMLAFLHLLWGGLMRMLAGSHVGYSDLPDSMDIGFQREYLLHFFVLYFLWRAWRRQAEGIKAAEAVTTT